MTKPTARRRLPAAAGQRSLVALTTVAALLCLLPLGLLAFATDTFAERIVTDEVSRHVKTTASVSAALVAEQLAGVTDLMDSYAGRPLLRRLVADGPAAADSAAVTALVEPLLTARPGVQGVFITDLSGRLTHAVPATGSIVGKDFSFRDWYRGITRTGKPYVSEAYETALSGRPRVVAIAVYITGNDGRPVAIIAAIYSPDAINATAHRMAQALGVLLTVTDQRGVVLASPEPVPPGGLVPRRGDPRIRRALEGRSGIMRSSTPRGPALAAYAPVAPLGWTVTAEVPTRSVFVPVRSLRRVVLLLSLLVGAAIVCGLGVLVRGMQRGRRMEAELVEEEERSRGIVDAASDAFVGMDEDGIITDWNAAAEHLFGWTELDAVGSRLSEVIIPPEQRATHDQGLEHYRRSGEGRMLGQRVELAALRRDGSEIPVELSIFTTEVGHRTRFNAFVQDITTRQREADALAAARDHAMDASRLKSEFLANMSHEIRTPMNGVLGMTSLLLDSPLDHEQRTFAQSVMRSGEGLLEIINDILDFSKIEAGKLDIETIEFDLKELVHAVVELLAPRAHEKQLEVAALLDNVVPDVLRGDPGRIRQVLTNLLGNAIKFTSDGEVVVRVTSVHEAATQVRVRVTVTDTGIGIDERVRERLFDAFAQADSSTTRRYGGTGLGLAISKQLVVLMGGTIGVDSEAAVGSTFWFEIPLAKSDAAAVITPVADEELQSLRVLVVDDNDTNREVLGQFLASWSVEHEFAVGGEEALLLLQRAVQRGRPFDVAIVDLNMPGVDGLEVGRRVAADPGLSTTRLVLLTSSGQRGEASAAQEAGFSMYLTKPVRQSLLLRALVTVMGKAVDVPLPIVTRHVLPDLQRPRVLVAEDNEVSQRVAAGMLQRLGYRVDVAAHGAEALEAFRRSSYVAVLMDCQMPVMDGYEATREMRRLERAGAHTPIIALSASAMAGDAEAAVAIGMDEYLTKPIAADQLARAMSRWAPVPGDHRPADASDGPPLLGAPQAPIDAAKIAELEGVGGAAFVAELLELFVSIAPDRTAALNEAVAAGDAGQARLAAHALRGSALNIGASALATACEAAETAAKAGDLAAVEVAASRMSTELARVVDASVVLRT